MRFLRLWFDHLGKKVRGMKTLKRILYPICALVILFSGWKLWEMKAARDRTEALYTELAALRDTDTDLDTDANPGAADVEAAKDAANPWLLTLRQQNPELAGWLCIPGTKIDYPVMQTAEDNDFYLTHDFQREENAHGAPFLDVNCRIGASENLIIYGHHMKDGTMFRDLMLYKNADFCESNGTIEFDTPEQSAQYQVIFVMLLSAKNAEDFPYYQYTDLSDEADYREFLENCGKYARWQSEDAMDESAAAGGLLTLSTCEYSHRDGRLVVVARSSLLSTKTLDRHFSIW